MSVDLGVIKIVPKDKQAVTATATSTGVWGNIWDIVKKTGTAMLQTGGNILLQKAVDKYAQPVNATPGYPPFARSSQSPDIIANPANTPTSKYATELNMGQSALLDFLKPLIQPAVSEGISQGIKNTASQPPVWVWVALGLLGVMVISKTVRG